MTDKNTRNGGDLAWVHISEADDNSDPDTLRTRIIDILSRGEAGADTQKWIAQLFAEDGRTYYRIDFSQRQPGNPEDRRQGQKNFFDLYDIWIEIENKRSFARIAAEKTGLHHNTIAKYRKLIEEAEKASMASEQTHEQLD